MAIPKYVRVPYKHQSWPKMVYHPVSGAYTIVKSESEIPEGFVRSLAETEYRGGNPAQCHDFTVPEKYITEGVKKSDEEDDDADDTDDVKIPTLKDLDMTRKEAIDILTEDGAKVAGNITNVALAELISKIM